MIEVVIAFLYAAAAMGITPITEELCRELASGGYPWAVPATIMTGRALWGWCAVTSVIKVFKAFFGESPEEDEPNMATASSWRGSNE